jgi:hypothetical protein
MARTRQPIGTAILAPAYSDATWVSVPWQSALNSTGYIRSLSGARAAVQDGNNYMAATASPFGLAGYNTAGTDANAFQYLSSAGLLNGATQLTLMTSFVFDSSAASVQWLNFRTDVQHTLDIFSQTSSSVVWGSDWAGAWNGANQQTLSGLVNRQLVTLVAVINQSGARFFANGQFSGTKAGSGFTVSTAASTTQVLSKLPVRTLFLTSAAIKRAIPDGDAIRLSANPWSLFDPSRRVVVFGAAAGGPTAYPLTAGPATATLTGADATFVYTPASTAYSLTASAGTATFAGSAATFSWGRAVNAAAGTAALAGTAATFSKGYQVTASAGTLTATGAAATFEFTGLVQYALTAEPSVVTVTGTSATFAYTGALVYTLTASPGSMTLTGRAATVGIPSASIWTDVGVSTATWSDVGSATSIWTDI